MQTFCLFSQSDGSFWMPPQSSTTAAAVDELFYLIFYISAFFFVLIVALMVVFAILYRRRAGVEPSESPTHSALLETVWAVIPTAIVVFIFYQGFVGYIDIRTSPRDSYEIRVTARKWQWEFDYPNGYRDTDLHVPVDRPVRLIMTSEDVIHSLAIPDFRLKMDVVPGRYTRTWFHAPKVGTHDLLCAEYCGTRHSQMLSSVIVHEPGEFELWLKRAGADFDLMTPVELGQNLYRRKGCAQCHSIDGTAKEAGGPSFLEIYGKTHAFTDGTQAVVDENYIRESILRPRAKVRVGYQDKMPIYKDAFTEDEIASLIEFIKSLK